VRCTQCRGNQEEVTPCGGETFTAAGGWKSNGVDTVCKDKPKTTAQILCQGCHDFCMPHMHDPGAVMDPMAHMNCHMNCDCTDCLQPGGPVMPHCEEAEGEGGNSGRGSSPDSGPDLAGPPSSIIDPDLPPRGDPGLPPSCVIDPGLPPRGGPTSGPPGKGTDMSGMTDDEQDGTLMCSALPGGACGPCDAVEFKFPAPQCNVQATNKPDETAAAEGPTSATTTSGPDSGPTSGPPDKGTDMSGMTDDEQDAAMGLPPRGAPTPATTTDATAAVACIPCDGGLGCNGGCNAANILGPSSGPPGKGTGSNSASNTRSNSGSNSGSISGFSSSSGSSSSSSSGSRSSTGYGPSSTAGR
jgi:hypothetical protein